MQTRILTTRDASTWNAYLSRLPGADIYHTAGYHEAHQANGDGTALCFVAEDNENILFHPFMVRDISSTVWYDIETVYGYSGPLCTSDWVWFVGPAWKMFKDWCVDNRVVAEFVRFSPLSANERLALEDPVQDRETVVMDLSGDFAAGYSPTARNKIRKAEQRGLTVDVLAPGASLTEFYSLYLDTMSRNGASDYYSFSRAYFETLQFRLGDAVKVFTVRDHGRPVASSLMLCYRDRLHYHLTGSDAEYRDSGAGNLLLHEAAMWGKHERCRWLHLGGGRTAAPDDALLRFKGSMSRERRPFYVGKRIHNADAYEQLCDEWKQQHPGQDGVGYFLLWRKP